MLDHTRVPGAAGDPEIREATAGLEDEPEALDHVVIRDEGYESWLAGQEASDPDPHVDPNDPYIIRHTGGTTGLPKGVGYTHRLVAAGRDWFYAWPPVEGDRCLHVGPISHGSGYFFIPIWLSGGCNLMLDHFDAEHCSTDGARADRLHVRPPDHAEPPRPAPQRPAADWRALKVLNVGGAPISDETALLAHEVFGTCCTRSTARPRRCR